MRVLASFVFHLLNFLRVPLKLALVLGSILGFVAGLAVLVYIPLGHKEGMLGGMAAIAFGGSFACYLVGVGYDKILGAVSRARFTAPRQMIQGVR